MKPWGRLFDGEESRCAAGEECNRCTQFTFHNLNADDRISYVAYIEYYVVLRTRSDSDNFAFRSLEAASI